MATPPAAPHMSKDEEAALLRRRRGRNVAMLAVLLGLVVLFYMITMAKLTTGP